MACVPVTYEIDAFHTYDPACASLKSCDRYTNPGMLPFAAHPLAHCSTTLTRSRVGLGSRSKLPTPKKTPPYPASRSTRSVGGDNHVTWVTSKRRPSTPTASGDTRCGSDTPGVA